MTAIRLLAGAVLLACVSLTAHADDALLREMRDRAEIEDLMWRYVRALDSFDAEGYAAVFTPDGQFGTGPNASKGREALKGMVDGLKRARAEREAAGTASAPMYHVIANSRLQFIDADHARMESYWMTVFGPAAQGETPRVAAVGRGIDELVRADGRWLIRLRNVAPQD